MDAQARGGIRKVLALRFVFNGFFLLSAVLFVLSYFYRHNNQYYYVSDPYFEWAIVCLFLGFFINLVYATR